jgi:elongation factor G
MRCLFRCQLVQKKPLKEWLTLITNQAIVWNEDDMGMTYEVIPIPEDLQDTVTEYRGNLLEAVAEYDEELLEKFFEDETAFLLKKFVQRSVQR